jgi:hypothetical protein
MKSDRFEACGLTLPLRNEIILGLLFENALAHISRVSDWSRPRLTCLLASCFLLLMRPECPCPRTTSAFTPQSIPHLASALRLHLHSQSAKGVGHLVDSDIDPRLCALKLGFSIVSTFKEPAPQPRCSASSLRLQSLHSSLSHPLPIAVAPISSSCLSLRRASITIAPRGRRA